MREECAVESCNREVHCKGLCVAHYQRSLRGDVRPEDPIGARKYASTCTVDGCERKHYGRGMCEKHYRRWERNGHTERVIEPGLKVCSVEGCDKVSEARGLCHGHYQRALRVSTLRDVDPLERKKFRTCSVEGCDRRVKARELCGAHLERLLRTGDVHADRLIGTPNGLDTLPMGSSVVAHSPTSANMAVEPSNSQASIDTCSVEGCERPAFVHGLCNTHDKRRRKFGNVRADVPIRVTGRSGYLQRGYRYVPVPKEERHLTDGRSMVQEHRLVMARHLGRPLTPEESVHHLNGQRTDNRDENLELWSRSQPSGARVADKLQWAKELIRLYEPQALSKSAFEQLTVTGISETSD